MYAKLNEIHDTVKKALPFTCGQPKFRLLRTLASLEVAHVILEAIDAGSSITRKR